NYWCLESDVTEPGQFRTTFIGEMPVVVVRGQDGSAHAFENRCAHRGALIAIDDAGRVKHAFQCVYHAWRYDLRGNLIGIAFEKGSNGRGGTPAAFRKPHHAAGQPAAPGGGGPLLRAAAPPPPADRGLPGRRDRRAVAARYAQAGDRARTVYAGAAEQLEALHRERQGHVSR